MYSIIYSRQERSPRRSQPEGKQITQRTSWCRQQFDIKRSHWPQKAKGEKPERVSHARPLHATPQPAVNNEEKHLNERPVRSRLKSVRIENTDLRKKSLHRILNRRRTNSWRHRQVVNGQRLSPLVKLIRLLVIESFFNEIRWARRHGELGHLCKWSLLTAAQLVHGPQFGSTLTSLRRSSGRYAGDTVGERQRSHRPHRWRHRLGPAQ